MLFTYNTSLLESNNFLISHPKTIVHHSLESSGFVTQHNISAAFNLPFLNTLILLRVLVPLLVLFRKKRITLRTNDCYDNAKRRHFMESTGSLRRFMLYTCLLLIFLIFLPASVPNKSRLRYFIVLGSLVSINLAGSTLFIPTIFFLWFVPKIATKYIWLVSSIFAKIIGVEVVFRNSEILSNKGKGIIILNHMTVLDTLVGCVNIRHFGDWVPTVKSELKWWGTYGIALRLNGAVFINRTGKGAMTELSRAARQLFRQRGKKTRLILFPEGTRNSNVFKSKDGKLLPFKLGAFRLAVENRVPIFPVVVSKYYFCDWPYRFERGIIVAKALEPIYIDPKEDLAAQAQKTRDIMEKEFITLSEEVRIAGEANQPSGVWSSVFCTICAIIIIYPLLAIYGYIEDLNCFDESFGVKYK